MKARTSSITPAAAPKKTGLRDLQRWFAAVVEHPRTADIAIGSRAATRLIPRADVVDGRVLVPNPRLDAAGMLQVYNGAYLSRLIEVLQSDFAALQYALGESAFHHLAAGYVYAFPSRHPNLNRLPRHMPEYVRRQRHLPQRAFLAELAELEVALETSFDAPEFAPLDMATLSDTPPERWGGARFRANPSVRLFAFRHPIDEFYQAWKEDKKPRMPKARASWLVVFRKDDRVWRQRVPQAAHRVLRALIDGRPLGAALAAAARAVTGEKPVAEWFQSFAADGLFTAVEFD